MGTPHLTGGITQSYTKNGSALVGFAMAGEVTDLVEDCGSTSVEVTRVTMEGCDQDIDNACVAKTNSEVKGQMFFKVTQPIDQMTCKIYAEMGFEIPFPGACPGTNGCDSLTTGKCPLEVGTEAVYNIDMNVPAFAPTTSLKGKWTLIDGKGQTAVCVLIPIKIEH